MDLRHSTFRFSKQPLHQYSSKPSRFFSIRSSLPFSPQKAKYYRELEAAVGVVQRACHLCVNVQKALLSDDGRILEKTDSTLVTIADFGVQALVSSELSKLFPSIPLVAEEDSAFVRSNNLANAVVNVVNDNVSSRHKQLTESEVLEAIDKGGDNSCAFNSKPATYWVLDPIDGTKGFVKGGSALYVVGLALVVDGEIVLGVMGCPNWTENLFDQTNTNVYGFKEGPYEKGIIMIAHSGCGTWTMTSDVLSSVTRTRGSWTRCSVDGCGLVHEAHFCIPDSQTWDSLPLSASYGATSAADSTGDKQILLLTTCCGSLCKYLMVASGRASVFVLRARAQTIIKAWDHAVGMICVHEAGGKVSDWKGSQLDLAADEVARRIIFPSGGVLVTNRKLHGHILDLLSSNS